MARFFFVNANKSAPFHFIGGAHRTITRIANEIFFAKGFAVRPDQVERAGKTVPDEVGLIANDFLVSFIHTSINLQGLSLTDD